MIVLTDRDGGMWQGALQNLQHDLAAYDTAKNKGGDVAVVEEEEKKLVKAMKRVGNSHPDPQVRDHWLQKALSFEKGNKKDKTNILQDLGKGLGILLLTPVALAGAAMFGAGAIIYGVGSFIKGLGNLLTAGHFRR